MKKAIAILLILIVSISVSAQVSAKTYTSEAEVYKIIKKNLINRNKEFTIEMDIDTMDKVGRDTDLFELVTKLDDKNTSKDGDYLKFSLNSWRTQWSWGGASDTAKLTFIAKYKTTLKQEQALDTKIKSILTALKLDKATDYKKVKAIHDYIINRVNYDTTYQRYSAYHALINKSAVCEGYTMAAYRMFTEAGIENRIITGTADGVGHAWNIIKVDGKWYNIDLTWDDPVTSTGKQILQYDYFLKSTKDFKRHARDTKYRTKEFTKAYPIAKTSYKITE
jgi:transglutaminase-like putative cysteine protease